MEAVNKMIGLSNDENARTMEIFNEMDTNHDGTVDREEFVDACLQNQNLMSHFRFNTQGFV